MCHSRCYNAPRAPPRARASTLPRARCPRCASCRRSTSCGPRRARPASGRSQPSRARALIVVESVGIACSSLFPHRCAVPCSVGLYNYYLSPGGLSLSIYFVAVLAERASNRGTPRPHHTERRTPLANLLVPYSFSLSSLLPYLSSIRSRSYPRTVGQPKPSRYTRTTATILAPRGLQ